MTRVVSSFAVNAWHTAPEGKKIIDPSSGNVVAEVSSEGLDFQSMVAHAKEVGGPALRAMTFHERALLLKRLAAYLTEHRGEVNADYATSGATAQDARIDVEGGIHLLSEYSKSALRELPNDTILLEGEPEMLMGSSDFAGQTIYSSRHGVSVFINAFNFPVWGMLEKLAPAVLAGLPVIVKPATATVHLAQIVARQIIESDILPAGTFQFVAGSLGNLLDGLGGQDHIAFTGSADTAAVLRTHRAVVERGAQLNVEADSLNASILGPDAAPATEEFTLFVKSVVSDITSKAGQKCTSIRRVLVPNDRIDEVVTALRESLGKVVVGDPREETTRMGPLVSASQRKAVEAAVRELMEVAYVAVGGPDATIPSPVADDSGFFPPTVLVATQPRDVRIHSIEAFGPVCTVLGYDTAEEAVELTALGSGSLVASVVSRDHDFVRSIVRGSAPFHGRVFVLNRSTGRAAPPPAAVLPRLIHGGPGRAGGGEELGGMRGVRRLMQATSIGAHPDMLVSLTDRWNPAAAQLTPEVHPFRLYLEELRLGDTLHTGSRLVTLDDIEHFAHFTGDTFYAHMDDEAAKASPLFEGRVAHGYFILAAAAGLFVDPEPGPVLANFGLENLRFAQPVYPGDQIKLRLTAKHKALRPGATWGEVTWNVEVTNQRDEPVANYDLLTINASRQA